MSVTRMRWSGFIALLSLVACQELPTDPSGNPVRYAFSSLNGPTTGRQGHIAVRLADGRVFVAGGQSGTTFLASAEFFDPGTGTWSPAPSMAFARLGHGAVTLADGRVFVAGGVSSDVCSTSSPAARTAEIFDPNAGRWTAASNMAMPRIAPVALRLGDGRVLVAGGGTGCSGGYFFDAEIYNPATNSWTKVGNMGTPRQGAASVLLPDGRVLVVGGFWGPRGGVPLLSAEIFNPATGLWTSTGAMKTPRVWAWTRSSASGFLVPLPDGRVLTAGGITCIFEGCIVSTPTYLASAEIYNPATGSWSAAGGMAQARGRHQMAILTGGRVLVAGGVGAGGILSSAEIFDPALGTFRSAGTLVSARQDYTGTPLADGRVVLAAGLGFAGALSSTEIYSENVAPVALLAGPVSGDERSPVAFSAAGSNDPNGDALTYAWSFGDGATATGGPDQNHPYATAGTYTVTVTVSDGRLQSTATTTATIAQVNRAPVAVLAGPVSGDERSPVAFSAAGSSDPDGDALTYAWDFGDGASATGGPAQSNTYATVGTYTVTVTVSDGTLQSTATTTATIAHVNRAPVALLAGPVSGDERSPVAFSAAGSTDPDGDALTYAWSFGDGATATGGPGQNHTYATAGTYTVTVTVSDGSLHSTATTAATIAHVNRAPVAALAGPVYGNEGASVAFSAAGSTDPDRDALTYTWDFGDGASALSGPGQSHVYQDNGIYTVTVTVSDGSLRSTATMTASVANVSPAVTLSASGAALLPGEQFTGSGTFTDPGADTWTATVDYGDGTGSTPLPLTGQTFVLGHRYMASGVFTVIAAVGDDDAGTGTAQVTVTVQAPQQTVRELLASLARLAAAGTLSAGEATSLAAPVEAAIAQLDRGNSIPAENQLRAFLSHLDAMVQSRRLSRAEADLLDATVNRVLHSLASGSA